MKKKYLYVFDDFCVMLDITGNYNKTKHLKLDKMSIRPPTRPSVRPSIHPPFQLGSLWHQKQISIDKT